MTATPTPLCRRSLIALSRAARPGSGKFSGVTRSPSSSCSAGCQSHNIIWTVASIGKLTFEERQSLRNLSQIILAQMVDQLITLTELFSSPGKGVVEKVGESGGAARCTVESPTMADLGEACAGYPRRRRHDGTHGERSHGYDGVVKLVCYRRSLKQAFGDTGV